MSPRTVVGLRARAAARGRDTIDSPDGAWTQVVDANGDVRRTTNIRGYATNHTLDALNRVTETRTPGDSSIGGSGGYSGGNHVTQYAYDIANGGLRDSTVTRVGSTNRVTTTQFDARGRAKMVIEPDGSTKMETIFDEQDQVVATHKWFGSNLQSATVNFRDARDRVDRVRTQDAAYTPGGSPTNHLSTYSLYNKAGSVEVSVSPLGSPTGSTHRTTYTLDARERATEVRDGTNNLVSQTSYYDDDLVKETFVPDPSGKTTAMVTARKYTYTCRKELKTSENRNCAGSTTVYGDLPGQVDTVTDALGRVAKTEYESTTQRPTAQWTAYGLPGASKVESVWTNGLLTQTKVFNPSTGSYDAVYARTYDKANRLELFIYPSGLGLSSESTSYNSFGETLALITASRTITHAYSTLGQNTTKTWSGAYSNVVTMEYDDAGHQKTLSEGTGGSQLRKETTFHVWKGTPNVETFKVGGSTWKSQTHLHDLSGNYVKFTDPEGKDHEWTVDNAGRVLDVKHDGVVVMSLTYTPGSLLDTTTVKNASGSPIFKTTHYYDELGRKSRQVTAKSSSGAVISAYRWEYDAGDRVVKLKLEHLGVEFVYGYDERDQLTSETTEGNSATGAPAFTNNIVSLPVGNEGSPSNEPTIQTQNVLAVSARSASWTYDKAGNRTAMTIDGVSTTFSYNAGSQLTSETWSGKTVSHTYDEWGNETVRTTVEGANTTVETYGYNYLNVMASYVKTLNSVTQANWQYQFWPTGDRYGKVDLVTSSNSEYYVPRMDDVAADYTSTLAIKNTYVQGTGIDSKSIRIPWSGSSPDNANRRHYLSDLVGTIGMTLTEAATVSETSVKDAWGNQIAGSTTERYGGLAQRETDGESSLVFVRARMYDPMRGRFTQTDPLVYQAPLTHYRYGSNRPTAIKDPFGLQDEDATEEKVKQILGENASSAEFERNFPKTLSPKELEALASKYGEALRGAYFYSKQDSHYKRKGVSLEAFLRTVKERATSDRVDRERAAKEKREKLAKQAEWDAKHKASGLDHPFDVFRLEIYAEYTDGTSVKIAGTKMSPTSLGMKGFTRFKGRALNTPGACECGALEAGMHFVQVLVTWPGDSEPAAPIYNPAVKPNAFSEWALWVTYSSTPSDYGWDMANIIGKYHMGAKSGDWVTHSLKNPRAVALKPGSGEASVYVDGKKGDTAHFAFKE